MDKVNRILKDKDFNKYLSLNKSLEKDRIFCKHDLQHFLDVARVAYIINLEEDLNLDKELVYGAGLLHDIARWQQYEDGRDHGKAGALLAKNILEKAGYDRDESEEILSAILHHRRGTGTSSLDKLIYKADKLSRPCIDCKSKNICKRFKDEEESFLFY